MDPDLERGPSRPSLHMRSLSGFGGSTTAGGINSPQTMYVTEPEIDEKASPDDRRGTRTSSFGRTMSGLHRRDTSLSQTTSSDPSSKIWGLYISQAERIDKEHSDSWTANTDGVLVFTGLFSAVVATFLVVSYPLLQPNSTDTTNQLLTQISRQLASNGTGSSQPSSLLTILHSTLPHLPTACALWATLMQQWTRRYVQVADRPYAPPRRARIRAFFSDGVEKFALAAAVEVLPALLHTSVLLFYIGLIDFLININHTVAFFLLTWVAVGVLTYFVLSMMPLFYPNSPYQTPLSSLCWFVMEAVPLIWLWLRRRNTQDRRANIKHGMREALESKAIGHTSRDTKALRWTLESLDEDHKLEDFLDALPGLFHGSPLNESEQFKKGLQNLVERVADDLFATCTTGFLPEALRRQRLTACLEAIWCFSKTTDRHFQEIQKQWDKVTNDHWGPLSPETWAVASSMTTDPDPVSALRALCIQAQMAVMWKKGRWQCDQLEAVALLQRQLGVSAVDIDRWLASGDQLQLVVAADLLFKSLPHLQKLNDLGVGTGADTFKELKAILDMICRELDASDVPQELRDRFVDSAKVTEVYSIRNAARHSRGHASIDMNGPWVKIFNTPWAWSG
ncbi:hypothetical protein BJV77DRAFT_1071138 [Russula vinacea]|nr:hypothetical protein BJV77DRAFT_1071138 [Russula vinacea]